MIEDVANSSRGEMAPAERKNYTDAVLCLTRKPPRLPTAEYPGVRSRFDDFVAYVAYDSELQV
jgi:tyrosinase